MALPRKMVAILIFYWDRREDQGGEGGGRKERKTGVCPAVRLPPIPLGEYRLRPNSGSKKEKKKGKRKKRNFQSQIFDWEGPRFLWHIGGGGRGEKKRERGRNIFRLIRDEGERKKKEKKRTNLARERLVPQTGPPAVPQGEGEKKSQVGGLDQSEIPWKLGGKKKKEERGKRGGGRNAEAPSSNTFCRSPGWYIPGCEEREKGKKRRREGERR